MWDTLDKDSQMWYTVRDMNILQKQLLKAFKDDDFAKEVLNEVIRPAVLDLDPKKKYILLLETPIDKHAEKMFIERLKGYDIVLLTGATGRLLELTMEEE